MTKRILSLLLVLALVLSLVPCVSLAASNISWNYDDNGTLTITGSGAMSDYSADNPAPWASYAGVITHVEVTQGITSIGDYAFAGLFSLHTATIPYSVTSFGDYSFYRCDSLKELKVPVYLTAIGDYAFFGCGDLAAISLPDTVTAIGKNAFAFCCSMESVVISKTATTIGAGAFQGSGLTSVYIPSTVTTIGENAFDGCENLTAITVSSSNTAYASDGTALFNKNKTTLLRLPGGYVGSYSIPSTVTSVGGYAMSDCVGLTAVTIPEGVTSLGDCSFQGCSSVTQMALPSTLSSIGNRAFFGCDSITAFRLDNGSSYFSVDTNGVLYNRSGNGLYRVPSAYRGTFEMPASVTLLANYALEGCSGITQVILSENLYSIAEGAFYGCSGLSGVSIPEQVSVLYSYAFYGCSGLTDIYLSGECFGIGRETFAECTSLSRVRFGGTPPTFGSMCFHNVTASATYPENTASWSGNIDNYGGNLSWSAYHVHSFTAKEYAQDCTGFPRTQYTCTCGESYTAYNETQLAGWSTTAPTGVSSDRIVTKTQYRYRDKVTVSSQSSALAGFTQISSRWTPLHTRTVTYVKSWPGGFSSAHQLYSRYHNSALALTASETATEKNTVHSEEVIGYLYYHWCYSGDYVSMESQTGSYVNFHAYYDTTAPENFRYDSSDGSYGTYRSDVCTNSNWYWPVAVYRQSATHAEKIYVHEGWSAYSDWSDVPVEAVDGREIQTQTLYSYFTSEAAGHSYANGVCSVCGAVCSHSFVSGVCSVCGMSCPHSWSSGTCSVCGLTCSHNYVSGVCSVCGDKQLYLNTSFNTPNPALLFEDEIVLRLYFTVNELGDLGAEDMGLLLWTTPQNSGTVDTAETRIDGAKYDSSIGYYSVDTLGIPAKKLGDTIYFKLYLRLPDGSYIYTKLYNYSPKTYAMNMVNGSKYSAEMKALAVAMLNYGAAAQTYFGYKPYNLVNNSLTDAQKALVDGYRSDMLDGIVVADSTKRGIFGTNNGFSGRNLSISFEGAFAINYYMTPKYTVSGDMTMYIWDAATYNSVSQLTQSNAIATVKLSYDGSYYVGQASGIAAKELDKTVYAAVLYTDGTTLYSSGVMAYSIGAYCTSQAGKATTMQPLAQATAVYGYYAKEYFN